MCSVIYWFSDESLLYHSQKINKCKTYEHSLLNNKIYYDKRFKKKA